MAKDKELVEEDSQNSEGKEGKEQTSEGGSPEGEGSSEHSETERQLYARAKRAEGRLKELEEQNDSLAKVLRGKKEEKKPKKEVGQDEIDRIVEVQRATKDLEPEAIAELKKRADVEGLQLSEAREDKNFQLWLKSYREEVESERRTAESSSRSPRMGGKSTQDMSQEEVKKNFPKLAKEAIAKRKRGRNRNI